LVSMLGSPSAVVEVVNDNGNNEASTTIEEASVEVHNTMSLQEENVAGKNADTITGGTLTETLEAAVKAALNEKIQQQSSNESSDHEEWQVIAPFDESLDTEIVGLQSCSNGQSCSIHEVCGDYVEVADLLRLISTVVTINGRDQGA
jgi:hypothetical protein